MLSIQQLIKALRKLQNNSTATANGGDVLKSIKHVAAAATATNVEGIPLATIAIPTAVISNVPKTLMTPLVHNNTSGDCKELLKTSAVNKTSSLPEQPEQTNINSESSSDTKISCFNYSRSASTSCSNHNVDQNVSSQQPTQQTLNYQTSHNECFSLYSPLDVDGSQDLRGNGQNSTTQDSSIAAQISSPSSPFVKQKTTHTSTRHQQLHNNQPQQQRSQRIQNFFRQQIFNQFQQFHTQHNQNLKTKQKQTQFAMSSLAAEPLTTPTLQQKDDHHQQASSSDDESSKTPSASKQQSSASGKPCFSAGLGDILQFMELIGNLKHTKRTGWVLRDINDCESISGHMYRMSILTFLLDGTEGLNQIRCMELALVHDLAESLVGDITPFCGISKEDKKAMELKAMEDICKLIEPRGKRMMELFEEYENGQSPESRFVKDLDRLDMVMQAYEYEKRDNCLLKHQEFFDSTEGKFKHPFVKKLVGEIYEQREKLAKAKGATPPPKVEVPNMDDPTTYASKLTNGHHHCAAKASIEEDVETTKSS